MNLAGVLPWIHWRGLLILGLLVAGNVFCMACPFTLPRTLARRWLPAAGPGRAGCAANGWRSGLVAVFLWSYEAFSLWDSPWVTAWIAIGYFVAAFVVDGFFPRRGVLQIRLPDRAVQLRAVARVAAGSDGARAGGVRDLPHEGVHPRQRRRIPGCELHLFQPRKQGNLDCTFCLDCVHACPHENVGLLAVVPGQYAVERSVPLGHRPLQPPARSGRHWLLVLVFGAFANAAGMVGPVVEWQDQLRSAAWRSAAIAGHDDVLPRWRSSCCRLSPWAVLLRLSRAWSCPGRESWLTTATRYSFALIPLGFGMWLAHYSFHFFTSCDTIIPATQRFAADHGWNASVSRFGNAPAAGRLAELGYAL